MARRLAWPSSSRTWPCQPCSPICSRVGWLWRTSPRGMPRSKMSSSRSPAGTCARTTMAASSYWPLWQLTISRMRIFYREPAAVFWVYGFPLVMAMSLGTAFRENPKEEIRVDLVSTARDGDALGEPWDELSQQGSIHQKRSSPTSKIQNLKSALASDSRFQINSDPAENWRKRLQAGKTDVVIEVNSKTGAMQLWDEPHRTESRSARHAI